MTTLVRSLVSKKKRRFNEDGYDLDLTCIPSAYCALIADITDNIVAMGYPAENMEGMYRNNMADVVRFFDSRHGDHYKVYNLCEERTYDKAKFHGRAAHYPFADHNAPPIELMQPFCEDVDHWLKADSKNVAVIHCKAGKGRTGVMICAYLVHAGLWKTADEALKFYGAARTKNSKGVTIPSQARYVNYYSEMIRGKLYRPVTLFLKSVKINTVPKPLKDSGTNLICDVKVRNVRVYTTSKADSVTRTSGAIDINLVRLLPLCGDIKFEFYLKTALSKEKLCHFWMNTSFVPANLCLSLSKLEIDKAHKDKSHKIFDANFSVELQFAPPEATQPVVEFTKTNGHPRLSESQNNLSVPSVLSEDEDSFDNDVGEEDEEGNMTE